MVRGYSVRWSCVGHLGSIERCSCFAGFLQTEEEAARAFHYRCVMLNLPFDPCLTFGQLAARSRELWDKYVEARPENPRQSWFVWRRDAQCALSWLRSARIAQQPVRLVCECQLLLQPYLDGRKKSHLLYKVIHFQLYCGWISPC